MENGCGLWMKNECKGRRWMDVGWIGMYNKEEWMFIEEVR